MNLDTNELVEQLKGLLPAGKEHEVDRLRGLMDILQEMKEQCRTEIEEREGGYQYEQKKYELEHAERMKALDMGQPIPDAGEIAKAQSAIRVAGTIGFLVPMTLIGSAIAVSVLVLQVQSDTPLTLGSTVIDVRSALFTVLWAICGLGTLFTVALSLRTIRRAREWSQPALKLTLPPSRSTPERSTEAS